MSQPPDPSPHEPLPARPDQSGARRVPARPGRKPGSKTEPAPRLADPVAPIPQAPPDDLRSQNAELRGASAVRAGAELERREAEDRLREREAQYRAVVETSGDGFLVSDLEGHILEVNDTYLRRSGYRREALLALSIRDLEALDDPPTVTRRIRQLIDQGNQLFETCHRTQDGTVWPVEVNASYWPIAGGRVFAFVRDLARRKRSEALLRSRLKLSDLAEKAELHALMQAALDEAELFTGSRMGFFHFVDPDQENLTLQAWSTNTRHRLCQAEGVGLHYPISQAGVWMDCVRARAAVIHNDYASLPHRKGMPEGHAPVVRELVVPVLRDGLITAILGVGNKSTDYTQEDVEVAEALASIVMDLVARKQAEGALIRSENLFRRDFEHAPVGRCLVGLDGRFFKINRAFCHLLGYTEEELNSLDFLAVTHPEDRPSNREGVAQLRAGTLDHLSLEKRYLTREQQIRWGYTHVTLVCDPPGVPLHFSVHVQDITARKQAEESLQRSEELLNRAEAVSKVGGWAWDVERQTMSWTHETYRLHEMNREEFTAGSPEHIAQSASCYAPADRLRIIEAFHRCIERGEPYDFEVPFTTAKGRSLWIRTTAEAQWEGGRIVRVVGNLMDITERKQAELSLRESEAFNRAVLDSLYAHVAVLNSCGDIIAVNEPWRSFARQNGVAVLEGAVERVNYLGVLANAVGADATPVREVEQGIQDVLAGRRVNFEAQYPCHSPAEKRWFVMCVTRLTSRGGGAVIAHENITVQRRAEEALRASLDEKIVLLKEVHHRVKNNLQIVSSLLNLQAHQTQNAELLKVLDATRNRVRSMALLHESLYQSTNLACLDLADYLESLCRHLLHASGPGTARVRLDCQVERIPLGLDHALPCGLLTSELVSNALKHAFPGERRGRVCVHLERRPETGIQLTVSDDGVGLPVGADPPHGDSLGLRLVSLLTQQLRGTWQIERESGTTVRVLFPYLQPPEPPSHE